MKNDTTRFREKVTSACIISLLLCGICPERAQAQTVTVTISPATSSVYPSATATFYATVQGTTNHAVTWSVNGTAGGNATLGTIVSTSSTQATYTAPATPTNPNTVSIQAQSVQNTASISPSSTVTLSLPTITLYPASSTPNLGQTIQYTVTTKGLSPSTVTWSVNGVSGGNATYGTISSSGLYTTPASASAGVVTVQATSVPSPTIVGTATVSLQNPMVILSTVTPSGINTGFNSLAIAGQNFVQGITATVGSTPFTVSFVSSTSLVVSGTTNAASGASVTLTITNPNPGSTSATRSYTVQPPISVTLTPATATAQNGATVSFRASISNTTNRGLNWLVNGIAGGNSSVGTLVATSSTQATYTAPTGAPAYPSVSVQAQSQQNPAVYSPASIVSLGNPTAVISSVSPSPINYGAVNLTIQGSSFMSGAQVTVGSVALTTKFISSTQLTATGTLSPVVGQMAAVTVLNPNAPVSAGAIVNLQAANPQMPYEAAFHFLEQATWAPTPTDIQNLQTIGYTQWFNQQKQAPLTSYTTGATGLSTTQSDFFIAALSGQDQLRQRVAFALEQIMCVSALKEATPVQMIPYLQLIENDSFGNFYQLIQDVTLSPTMGEYLNMADNYAPSNGQPPNQNYARELMQLFTIGSILLNPDGSPQLDANGNQIATYTDPTIQNFARILTGWTFAPAPGVTNQPFNQPYFGAPMVAYEGYHDMGTKTLLNGVVTVAGQTAEADLQTTLQNLFNHQNVGPFIALRLIQHLVESNPSPAYIQRIGNVFANDGTGTRGNLWAVIQAILTDPEAQDSYEPSTWLPNGGHLREPVLYISAVLKELNAQVSGQNQLGATAGNLGEFLFSPPSVFSYYQPTYPLPGNPSLLGPEFYLLDSSTGLAAINWNYSVAAGAAGAGISVDFTPFMQFGTNPQALVTAMSNAFMAGQMPATMQSDILSAIGSSTNANQNVQTAFYLTSASPFYMVER